MNIISVVRTYAVLPHESRILAETEYNEMLPITTIISYIICIIEITMFVHVAQSGEE
jgi:hypothetical protein